MLASTRGPHIAKLRDWPGRMQGCITSAGYIVFLLDRRDSRPNLIYLFPPSTFGCLWSSYCGQGRSVVLWRFQEGYSHSMETSRFEYFRMLSGSCGRSRCLQDLEHQESTKFLVGYACPSWPLFSIDLPDSCALSHVRLLLHAKKMKIRKHYTIVWSLLQVSCPCKRGL
jgi:hypothetical protein